MTEAIEKLSYLVPSQLPEFIRDDVNYEAFVAFIEAYYEWAEQQGGFITGVQGMESYRDIDETLDEFVKYYINDFLPYFPQDALSDPRKVLKIAKNLYEAKGTTKSFKLLFRLLYNSDSDITYSGDLVLRASAGKWYVPRYIKIKSNYSVLGTDQISNYRLFGELSKSFASIERGVTNGNRYDVYITADIERLFQSGETVRVVDIHNQPIYTDGYTIVSANTVGAEIIRGSVVGSISTITIDPKRQGLKYNVGDPVIVYGGLGNINDLPATAYVSQTSNGSILRVVTTEGGYGYRSDPNTVISVVPSGGALLNVSSLNPNITSNVTLLPIDRISVQQNVRIDANNYSFFANAAANIYCSLANAFSFTAFTTHPIAEVEVNNGGGGFQFIPTASALAVYDNQLGEPQDLSAIGILSNIVVNTAGHGYANGDSIVFSGGTGFGAFANVTVNASGSIVSADYIYDPTNTVLVGLGGMGYTLSGLPSLVVSSVGGVGANVAVYGILGTGAEFSLSTDRIGQIKKITVSNSGEDYVAKPNVSIRIQDLMVTNFEKLNYVERDDLIFQGVDPLMGITSYSSYIDSVNLVYTDPNGVTNNDIYLVRVYNYDRAPSYANTIYVDVEEITPNYPTMNLTSVFDNSQPFGIPPKIFPNFVNGVRTYGDGTAKASTKYLQGLTIGDGYYISTLHQPSSYSVLQSERYNDFTYEVAVEQPISKYREILKTLINPVGMKFYGKNVLRSVQNLMVMTSNRPNKLTNVQMLLANSGISTFGMAMSNTGSYVVDTSNGNNHLYVSNTIEFTSSPSWNVGNICMANDVINLNDNVSAQIYAVDNANSVIILTSNVFLTINNTTSTSNVYIQTPY